MPTGSSLLYTLLGTTGRNDHKKRSMAFRDLKQVYDMSPGDEAFQYMHLFTNQPFSQIILI